MLYLWEDGDLEGLVAVLAHQIEGDDGEYGPGGGASLPAHQLLPQPEARRKLLRLHGTTTQRRPNIG